MKERSQHNSYTQSEVKPPIQQIPYSQPYSSKINWEEMRKQAAAEGWQEADSCTISCPPKPQPDPCGCKPENECDQPKCDSKEKCDHDNEKCDNNYDHKYKRLLFASWALLGLASLLALFSLLNTFFRQSISITVPYTVVAPPTTPTPTVTYIPAAPSPIPPERLW